MFMTPLSKYLPMETRSDIWESAKSFRTGEPIIKHQRAAIKIH